MRKFVVALGLLLGVVFLITRFAEVQAIGETLKRGDWRFLILALGVQFLWLFIVAISYRTIFALLGIQEKIPKLILTAAASNFVNVVAPTAGVGGVSVFVSEARRNGYSSARATVAGVVYVLFDYAAFLCVLLIGLVVLFKRNNLNTAELVASGAFLALLFFLSMLIVLGLRSGEALGGTLAWLARQINRFLQPLLHREYLSESRAHSFARDASEGLAQLSSNPGNLLLPFALALCGKALLIGILFLMCLAFNVPLSGAALIACFAIGYLFFIVSPTPSGIGFVEGALTLVLGSMYVPLGAAAVVSLAYRGITFWVPFAIGGLALRLLHQT